LLPKIYFSYIHVPGDEEAVYNALKNASKEIGHFTVYQKEEILDRWHYKNNRRAPPILVLADEAYAFDDVYQFVEDYEKLMNKTSKFHIITPHICLLD
jgi:ectonucleotide pyrophosphatase/phosphodiesterase family protein 5